MLQHTKDTRRKAISSKAFLIILFTAASTLQMENLAAQSDRSAKTEVLRPFAGTWVGVCQDCKPFVVVTLNVSASELVGSISMGNMKGADGQCAAVLDPPSPEHAMTIKDAKIDQNQILSFQGSPAARFEMALAGADKAKLKFLDTPVEDNPWELTKSADKSR